MDQAIQPIGQKPLLVRRGATFTRIIVNQVQATDGEMHQVMFIGTGECVQSLEIPLPVFVFALLLFSGRHSALSIPCFCVSVQKEEGMLLKAVNYAGEMFIIEEVQLFQPPASVKILKFSNVTVSDVQCYHS